MDAACAETSALLAAWVDGEMEAADAAEVEAHLAACPACAGRARQHALLKDCVRRAAAAHPSPTSLRTAVLSRLDDEVRPGPWPFALGALPPRAVALGAAAAGMATWFLLGGLLHPVLPGSARPALLEDGIALHSHPLPLDYAASDAGSVQRWLSARLDYGVRLPAFEGPSLQGVRLSTLQARPAALVRYQVPQSEGRVSLLIVDDPAAQALPGEPRRLEGREVWLSRARGYNVASWRRDEVVYSLISDLDERDVLELVRAAQRR